MLNRSHTMWLMCLHVVTKTWRCHHSSYGTKTTGGQPPQPPPFPTAQSLHLDDNAFLVQHSPNLVRGRQHPDNLLAHLRTVLFKDQGVQASAEGLLSRAQQFGGFIHRATHDHPGFRALHLVEDDLSLWFLPRFGESPEVPTSNVKNQNRRAK